MLDKLYDGQTHDVFSREWGLMRSALLLRSPVNAGLNCWAAAGAASLSGVQGREHGPAGAVSGGDG